MSQWADTTLLVWENQKATCRICGKRIWLTKGDPTDRLVGHHKEGRRSGDHSTTNCEARHAICEAWAHKVHPSGNPGISQIMEYRYDLQLTESEY